MIKRILVGLGYFLKFVYYKSVVRSDQHWDIIYQAVEDLGGLPVKLIQFICLRTDLFPSEAKIAFLNFYDEVPFEELQIKKILQQELGEEKLKFFATFEEKPFASGTFAQVYRGKLTDGTNVVIKAKRESLKAKLSVDFVVLKLFAVLADFIYYQKIVDIKKLVKEFESLTYQELDYRQEAKNAEYFYRLYQDHPYVYIPKTYPTLSSKNILVQEYVGGIAIADLIRARYQGLGSEYGQWLRENYHTDIKFIMKKVAYELGLQGMYQDKFYADPHPGNIKVLPNNKYALIDFGIVGASPLNKRTYYEIISLISSKAQDLDTEHLGEEFLKWGGEHFYECLDTLEDYFGSENLKLKEFIIKGYRSLLDSQKEEFHRIEIEEKENFVKMLTKIIQAGHNFKVKIPQGMLPMMRTIAIYKSWSQFLEPDYFQMRNIYRELLGKVDKNQLVNYADLQKKERISLEQAIEDVCDWLVGVAESNFPLYQKISTQLGVVHV